MSATDPVPERHASADRSGATRAAAALALFVATVWAGLLPGGAAAQDLFSASADSIQRALTLRPEFVEDPVRVLVLGTFHFSNPGRDVVNPTADDVLSPRRQRELEALLEDLEAFRPTKIAIEATPEEDSAIQARYRAIRADEGAAGRREEEQIGMRLAARGGHERVYPIDHRLGLDLQAVFEYAGEHDPELSARLQGVLGTIGESLQSLIEGRTLSEILIIFNDPELSDIAHGLYMEQALIGAGEGWIGADVVTDWYERNLKIFGNLAAIAEPGDRILVVYGQGHEALLRHYVAMTPGFEVVTVAEYVEP